MRSTSPALDAFVAYRDMGTGRSTAKVAQALGKSKALMDRWSSRDHWQDRVKAHDQAIADEAAERDKAARLADIDKRRQDRLKVAAAARGKGAGGLSLLAPESIADVVRLFDYADRTERLDMGEPDQRIALGGPNGEPLRFTIVIDRGDRDDSSTDADTSA